MNTQIHKSILIFIAIFITSSVFGQGVSEAMRYSFTGTGGTARTIGVGGSFGAMGGDYSVVNINPAGIGTYKKGEFTITPSLTTVKTTARLANDGFNGYIQPKSKNIVALDNVGLVVTNKKGTSSFTIGFSKIADLSKNFNYSGITVGSITERFKERANGKKLDALDDFEGYAAYNVGAIFDADSNTVYESDFDNFSSPTKSQIINQSGYINELSLAWGKKLNERVFFGVSIGVPFINYEESKSYEEFDPKNQNPIFTSLKYDEYLQTTGAGANLKVGVILQPVKGVRIGGAIHTPTYYKLNDDYNTALNYSYYDGKDYTYDYQSPNGSFQYRFNTPAKLIGSLGYIYELGKLKGFINGDVEWVDYNTGKFDFTAYSTDPSERTYTDDINEEIEKYLGTALNLRLGSELVYGKLRFRAGVESGQDPVSANSAKIQSISYGLGYREHNFFIDLGVRTRSSTEGYVPYVLIDPVRENLVKNKVAFTKMVATIGFKF